MENTAAEEEKVNIAAEAESNSIFDTEYLKVDLKGRFVRGGVVTMAAQGATFFFRMGSTVILARLLTPQDFGIVTMVTAVTGFIVMFKDIGLSMATVQKAEINHAQISTLFWINVIVSLGLVMTTIALAPAIAWFYDEPRLTWITLALAGAFVFSGLTIQHQALLRRQMHFGALALIQIISMLAGFATAIISAWYGAGYWSLVLMELVRAIAGAVGVWLACDWRPHLPVRRSGVRSMLSFGGNLTGFNVMNYLARNVDNMLIGWRWGSEQLGLYAKACGLLMLPLRQINAPLSAVVIPTLSRLQGEPARYRRSFLQILQKVSMMILPPVALLVVVSDWIIELFLGSQWTEASTIFAWLSVIVVLQAALRSTGWLFITQGRTREMFIWGIISSLLSVSSFVVGLPWGAVGVAASFSISGVLVRIPILLWFVGRKGPVSTIDIVKTILPLLFNVLCVATILIVIRSWLEIKNPIIGLVVTTTSMIIVTVMVYFTIPSTRHAGNDIWLLLRSRKSTNDR
jgi:PST family polysaccharide transporter